MHVYAPLCVCVPVFVRDRCVQENTVSTVWI